MKFRVTRTSSYAFDEEPPCEGASKALSELYGDGQWYIELKDLEALTEFLRRYGSCVISDGYIEIYDDYRE